MTTPKLPSSPIEKTLLYIESVKAIEKPVLLFSYSDYNEKDTYSSIIPCKGFVFGNESIPYSYVIAITNNNDSENAFILAIVPIYNRGTDEEWADTSDCRLISKVDNVLEDENLLEEENFRHTRIGISLIKSLESNNVSVGKPIGYTWSTLEYEEINFD